MMKTKKILGISVITVLTLMFVYVGFDSYGSKMLEVFQLDLIFSAIIVVAGTRVKETKVSFFALLLMSIPRVFYMISNIIVFKDVYLIEIALYFSYAVLLVLFGYYLWKKDKGLSLSIMKIFVLGISILFGSNIIYLSFKFFITGEFSKLNYISSEYSFLVFIPALLYILRNINFKLKLIVFGIFLLIQSIVLFIQVQANLFCMNSYLLHIVCVNILYIIIFAAQVFILKREYDKLN